MKMRLRHLSTVLALVLPLPAAAQTNRGDQAAASALGASHIGALTPLMTPAMVNRRFDGAQLALRYGLRGETGSRTNALAVSGVFGVGFESTVMITAGFSDAECTGCSPQLMLGVGGDMRVIEATDFFGSGSVLHIGVAGDAGYASLKPATDVGIALGVGVPMTLVLGGTTSGVRIAPFFTPTFGIGHASLACPTIPGADCSNSGTRFLLGGGIGFWKRESSISATLGVQQVLIDGSKPVFGINVLIGGR